MIGGFTSFGLTIDLEDLRPHSSAYVAMYINLPSWANPAISHRFVLLRSEAKRQIRRAQQPNPQHVGTRNLACVAIDGGSQLRALIWSDLVLKHQMSHS